MSLLEEIIMIDRLTKSSLKEFKLKLNFKENIKEDELFEHFINYIILERKLDERIDEDFLDSINIGQNGTIGIDGFCMLINKQPITSKEELKELIEGRNDLSAEVFFIQSKTSNNFDSKEILNFGDAIEDFVSETQKLQWTDLAKNKIELFNYLIENSTKLSKNPICHIFYATLGEYKKDQNIEERKEKVVRRIESQQVFESIQFSLLDHSEIHSIYKSIGQKISRKFNFGLKTLMPDINKVHEAYIGLVPVKTIIDLITDNEGELIPSVFYDNVRDFQGENAINLEIKKTILDNEFKHAFSILNNGITIISEKFTQSRDVCEITNYQIINGLQTSRILLSCKDNIDEKMFVTIKLVVTEDENLISKIIQATNRQTAVKEEDLIAYSEFQKKLEDFFKTFDGEGKLYYERRSKQYNIYNINQKYIVDKSTLIKAIGSFYFKKPQMATRYFGRLFKEFGDDLFKKDHLLEPYYMVSLLYKKIESTSFLERKYRKLRYFILMMFSYEYNKEPPTKFNSKEMKKYCEDLINLLNDDNKFKIYLDKIIKKIDSLNIDLNDNELSKSSDLVEKIKNLYKI